MKYKSIILIICSLFLIIGCTNYSCFSLSGSDFYGKNKVIKNIDRYDVYVHQADSVYELVDPEALEAKDIPKKTVIDTEADLRHGKQDDIHIYMDDEVVEYDYSFSNKNQLSLSFTPGIPAAIISVGWKHWLHFKNLTKKIFIPKRQEKS